MKEEEEAGIQQAVQELEVTNQDYLGVQTTAPDLTYLIGPGESKNVLNIETITDLKIIRLGLEHYRDVKIIEENTIILDDVAPLIAVPHPASSTTMHRKLTRQDKNVCLDCKSLSSLNSKITKY